ncbi:MAG: type II secretion system F family protein [Eubacterium sp.]|uniref:type II secretion system F family protein n=1 Tax=Eubacterium sp. F2 TaxID=3381348 RepID=UPI0039080685|nr:type II secretion system F family protein [Eubacterium sp.]MCI2197044.1 type II secretion system F family protein [Eubacterium sp.]
MKQIKEWKNAVRGRWEESDAYVLLEKKKERLRDFLKRGENRKRVCLILSAALLLSGVQAGKGLASSEKYIRRSDGSISGLMRKSTKERAAFPLSVEAGKGKQRLKKEVTIVLEADGSVRVKEKQDPKKELKQAIQKAVRDAETAGTKKVSLPSELSDGTVMNWNKKGDCKFLVLLLMGPLLCALLYLQDREKEKEKRRKKMDSVFCALPAFNDQLILLLNCGMVFYDAFQMIADGYREQERQDYFSSLILSVQNRSRKGKLSLRRALTETAEEEKNEHFSRFAETVSDSQIHGTDMLETLEKERDRLWKERKNAAQKKGKLAESRLALPLAVLLLVLIVITAAPAVIQVQQ